LEVVKRLWLRIGALILRWLVPAWLTFADVVGGFIEEAAFRVVLAFNVLAGRKPQRLERRWWNRSAETPLLIDCLDWTSDRLIFSVIVWPSLESSSESADDDMRERVEEVLDAIAKGASEKMWCTRWEVNHGLRWNATRACWVASDGYGYDGDRDILLARRTGGLSGDSGESGAGGEG
jgi:hypothetical protein